MKQPVYDVLLIGISHLFAIMMLENTLLFSIIEKKFSKELPREMNKLFNNISSFDIKENVNEYIDKMINELPNKDEGFQSTLKNILDNPDLNQSIKEIRDVILDNPSVDKSLKEILNAILDNLIYKKQYNLINNEKEFMNSINNYNKNDIKKNNLIIKVVVVGVNVFVFLLLLLLILYGSKKTNKIRLNWKYLIISNIVSLIIIGVVDGVFINSFQGEMFNIYEVIKQYVDYVFQECND